MFGLLKFIFACPYRNKIDTAFIIYGNDRGILISYLLNCKNRIANTNNPVKYMLTKNCYEQENYTHMQDINGSLITALTGEKTQNTSCKIFNKS